MYDANTKTILFGQSKQEKGVWEIDLKLRVYFRFVEYLFFVQQLAALCLRNPRFPLGDIAVRHVF